MKLWTESQQLTTTAKVWGERGFSGKGNWAEVWTFLQNSLRRRQLSCKITTNVLFICQTQRHDSEVCSADIVGFFCFSATLQHGSKDGSVTLLVHHFDRDLNIYYIGWIASKMWYRYPWYQCFHLFCEKIILLIDWHKILYRHSLFPDNKASWLEDPNFSYGAIIRSNCRCVHFFGLWPHRFPSASAVLCFQGQLANLSIPAC